MRLTMCLAVLISSASAADFTTYIGAAQSPYQPAIDALAVDSDGNTYVTGGNAVVAKLDPTGNVAFSATLGPNGVYSNGFSIALDPAGNVWVGGQTAATNFPLTNALQSSAPYAGGTGFLVKMSPQGAVLYSSYFAGTLGNTSVSGVATDQDGNVYVTGWTDASDFPITPGLPASRVNPNAPAYGIFVAKLNSTGQKILYSTVITGSADCAPNCFANTPKTLGVGIAVDGSGNALVTGISNTDLPALPGGAVGPGSFVFKINATGNAVVCFTSLGISLGSRPIAADASGNAYLTGSTNNPDFPATPGAYQTVYGPGNYQEVVAMKLSPSGATLWATFLDDQSNSDALSVSINLDNSDNAWLTGTNGTTSAQDANFVAELSADGCALPYTANFPVGRAGQDIAVDPAGVVHYAGSIGLVSTITPTEPLAQRALSIVNAASWQFLGTVAPGEIISIYGVGLGPATPVVATPGNGSFPTSLGGVQVLANGTPIPLL